MFCQNCGKNLEQGELFCSACGTKVEAQPAQPVEPTYTAPAEPVYTAPIEPTYTAPTPVEPAYAAPVAPAPTNGGNKKLFIILGIVGAAVLVLAIAAYFIIGAISNTPENVAEDFATAYCEIDPEGMVDCVPEFMLNELADRYNVIPDKDAIISAMEIRSIGEIPKSLQILSAVRTTDFTLADILEDPDEIEDYGGTIADVALITDACEIEMAAIVNGEQATIEVYCIEYDGNWCALEIDVDYD